MIQKIYIILFIFLVFVGCSSNNVDLEYNDSVNTQNLQDIDSGVPDMVDIITSDNVKVPFSFVEKQGNKAVILLHQYNMDKSSYDKFVSKLDITSLAIDLRGFGESELNYENFEDQDFLDMQKDVEAAQNFLEVKGYTEIYIIGASIGANTAYLFSAQNNVKKVVLLSPGMKYHGIDISKTLNEVQTLIIASSGDVYSFDTSKTLDQWLPYSYFHIVQGDSHGTNMLDAQTTQIIINFLNE